MSKAEISIKNILTASEELVSMDPQDEAIHKTVEKLHEEANLTNELAKKAESNSFGEGSMEDDVERLHHQTQRLKAAAATPARNYRRIYNILENIERAIVAAKKPENAQIRPTLRGVVLKVAGIFSKCDTVQDLDRPLEEIEKAIKKLYGDQSQNSTFYFDRRNVGHHGDK